MQFSQSDRLRILMEEYRRSQDMHNYYGRLIWEMGAIFVGGGLAALGLAASREKILPEAIAAIGGTVSLLMLIFYFNVRRSREIAEVHLARCREVEEELDMWQHRYAWEATHDIRGVEIPGEIKPIIVPEPSGYLLSEVLAGTLIAGSLLFVLVTAGLVYSLRCLQIIVVIWYGLWASSF